MPRPNHQSRLANKALDMKQKAGEDQAYLERQTDTASEGPIAETNREEPVTSALDAEGHRPVLERSRKVR